MPRIIMFYSRTFGIQLQNLLDPISIRSATVSHIAMEIFKKKKNHHNIHNLHNLFCLFQKLLFANLKKTYPDSLI